MRPLWWKNVEPKFKTGSTFIYERTDMTKGQIMCKSLPQYLAILLILLLSSCQSACPEGSIQYFDSSMCDRDLAAEPVNEILQAAEPQEIEIRTLLGTKAIRVDGVIHGFLCDDTWSGTVYVGCDIEIPFWEDDPFFFQDCKPTIEPNTIVYVAAHNDKAYSEGCSCHE